MAPFIFGVRSNVHIIDLEVTLKKLEEATAFAKETASQGGKIMFVATKRQAQGLVKDAAISCGMPYMVDRWIGGLLTNFPEINKIIKRYHQLKDNIAAGKYKSLNKKERLTIDREVEKLEGMIVGIRDITKTPDALFVVDLKKEKTAVAEANKIGIPIIAMTDTNVNPDLTTYPIPSNDDATKSISTITSFIAEAINEGKKSAPKAEATPIAKTTTPSEKEKVVANNTK